MMYILYIIYNHRDHDDDHNHDHDHHDHHHHFIETTCKPKFSGGINIAVQETAMSSPILLMSWSNPLKLAPSAHVGNLLIQNVRRILMKMTFLEVSCTITRTITLGTTKQQEYSAASVSATTWCIWGAVGSIEFWLLSNYFDWHWFNIASKTGREGNRNKLYKLIRWNYIL